MVNALKIPFMGAEGVGRLRCVEIFLSSRPLQRACNFREGTCWGSREAPCSSGCDKSKATNDSPMLWKSFRIQVHGKRLTVPETA